MGKSWGNHGDSNFGNHGDRFLIPGAINNECVAFSIIEIEKLCKENKECKAEQAYVRNQKPVPMIQHNMRGNSYTILPYMMYG